MWTVLLSVNSLGGKYKNPYGKEEKMLRTSLGSPTHLFKEYLGKKDIFGTRQ